MADRSGFPYCTKWKNYRYPLTRLPLEDGYTVATKTGNFATEPLDIWISDDYFLDTLDIDYQVKMTSATNDLVTSLTKPQRFVDGGTGANTVGSGTTNPHAKLDNPDSLNNLAVDTSYGETIGSGGAAQTLYTIIPGLHFAFSGTTETGYLTGNVFTWRMDSSALDGLPKVMDGTYTCWYMQPLAAGDTVVTEPFPSGLGNKSITIIWNSKRHIPKRSTSNPNNGMSMTLQGSVDNVNYYDIVKLIDDIDMADSTADTDNFMSVSLWDSNALDGDDSPYKRLKFEYETGGDTVEFHAAQFIEISITPS